MTHTHTFMGTLSHDCLTHYMCRRMRHVVERAVLYPCRTMPPEVLTGLQSGRSPTSRALDASRLVVAALTYHWARAK